MTKTRSTKAALMSSILALFLCVTMLLGTTFAWFTDSVTSANNIIKSGNLDIELEYWDGTDWVDVSGKADILTNELWEPGVTEVAYLKVNNAGTLALKYQLGINIVSETEGTNMAGDPFKLSDYIMFGVVEGQQPSFADRDAAVAAVTGAQKISAGYTKADSIAAGAAPVYLALVVYMPTSVGNEANYKKDTTPPQISLGINVMATQLAAEEDSFGSDYDSGAVYLENTSESVAVPDNATEDVVLKTEGESVVNVEVPAEVLNSLPAAVTSISLGHSDPKVESGVVVFDSIELIDQNGNIIDLEALNLTENITVTLSLPASAFTAGDDVMVYHDGAYVATATVDANGNIEYSAAHFCEVTVGAAEAPTVNEETGVVEIANASQLISFAADVNAGNDYKGKTVVLTANINLKNGAWTPIGSQDLPFMGTFDGQGHTISNLYIRALDTDCVGLFGFIGKTTIKNFNIHNVDARGDQRVAAVVGATKPSAVIDNVHVSGSIEIFSDTHYAAGIVTHGYVNVKNCSVIAETKGTIGSNGSMVGGICGWRGEGGTVLTNCHVKNIDMTGYASIGGLAALIHYNNEISECSVENVNLTKTRVDGWGSIGALSGNWGGVDKAGTAVYTVTNNTIKNVTLNGTAIKIFSDIYGSKYSSPEADMPLVESGNTFENIKSNLTLVTAVSTADALESAIKEGGNVVLSNDIVMNKSISISNADFVLDGNGHTITMADGATNTYALFDITGGKATIKNVTFDGIKDGAIVRTVGVEFNADKVTAVNGNHTQQQGLFRLLGKSTITNCVFQNNACNFVITLNFDADKNEYAQVVKNCVFEENTCNGNAVLYYVCGTGATIDGNKFISNKVESTSNAATVYMGFTENNVITNNVFDGNDVTTTGTTKRVAGAIMIGYEAVITGNSFVGNKVTGENAKANNVAAAAYYTDIDLSGNYWGGSAPVENDDYYNEYPNNYSVIINDYLTTYGN